MSRSFFPKNALRVKEEDFNRIMFYAVQNDISLKEVISTLSEKLPPIPSGFVPEKWTTAEVKKQMILSGLRKRKSHAPTRYEYRGSEIKEVLDFIRSNPHASERVISDRTGFSRRFVRRVIQENRARRIIPIDFTGTKKEGP